MKQQNIKTLIAFGAIYVIWGSTYLAVRYAVETIPPFMMIGIRSLTAGIILYFISRSRGKEKIRKENIIPLVTIGALFFLIGHGLLAWSNLKYIAKSSILRSIKVPSLLLNNHSLELKQELTPSEH